MEGVVGKYPTAEPHLPRPLGVRNFWECKFPLRRSLFVPVEFLKRHFPGNTASPRICIHSTSKKDSAPKLASPRETLALFGARAEKSPEPAGFRITAEPCSRSRGIFNRLNFLTRRGLSQPMASNHTRRRHAWSVSGHPDVQTLAVCCAVRLNYETKSKQASRTGVPTKRARCGSRRDVNADPFSTEEKQALAGPA